MKKLICCSCAILIVLFSCKKDFVVENIENKTVSVNGPGDNLKTTSNVITFWWNALDGAEKYTLQVVKPNFAQAAQLVLDTNIAATKFNFSLQPGIYQWRVKAFNAGHSTAFQTFNLRIDTTNNLSLLLVNLLNPANGSVIGNAKVTFNWSPIIAATRYRIQVNSASTTKDTVVTTASFTYSLSAAANATTAYTWNVMALNDNSQTQFNTTPFTFTVDLKPPTAPTLLSPTHGASVKDTTKLVWLRNGTDVQYDSVYVADDSTFSNILNQAWTDQSKLLISSLNRNPNIGTTFYWWRVRSFDAVGNRSTTSARYKFKLIP